MKRFCGVFDVAPAAPHDITYFKGIKSALEENLTEEDGLAMDA